MLLKESPDPPEIKTPLQAKDLWSLGDTPIKIGALNNYLDLYPLQNIAAELRDGFTFGFRLNYNGPRYHRESSNLVSAFEHKIELKEKILKEINLGRIVGPFDNLPIPNLQISPIGIVPKSDGVSWRLITHLSFPRGMGINDFIDEKYCTVHYTSFDKVIEMIADLGPHAELAVVDIKSAFRLLPVFPGDFDLLGIKFEGQYYIDKCLPMGCSVSCNIFEKFSTFLHWVVENNTGLSTLDHYLDDFIFAGRAQTNQCKLLRDNFLQITKNIGVPIAPEKLKGPTTVLVFLGFEIDTDEMVVRIPREKLDALLSELQNILGLSKITLKNLQALVGSLNFFSRAIRSARAFNRRFYDLTVKVRQPHHFIRLTKEVKEDIGVWVSFLQSFNGKTYFPESEWSSNDVLELFTDSCGSIGCGAYFSGEWVHMPWPDSWIKSEVERDITFLEFVPIVLAMSIWGSRLRNKKIKFFVDNLALVEILNKQTSKSKRVMSLMRPFVLYTMQNNIIFRSHHILGALNSISDSISRQEWRRFRSLAPTAKQNPERIPQHFLDLILSLKLTD